MSGASKNSKVLRKIIYAATASAVGVGVGVGAFSLQHQHDCSSQQRGTTTGPTSASLQQHQNQHQQHLHPISSGRFETSSSTKASMIDSLRVRMVAPKTTLCAQASPQQQQDDEIPFDANSFGGGDPSTYYYKKMRNPPRKLADSHAIFGALRNPGYIERYDAYRRVQLSSESKDGGHDHDQDHDQNEVTVADTASTEVCVADIRIGKDLNGHEGIVHGGIISLMLDDTFGWGYEAMCLMKGFSYSDAENGDLPYVVTANLDVNYRAPLPSGSNVVIRVRHEKTDGRKVYFSSRMESHDGSILYAEATALFITVKQEYLKN